MRLSIKVVLTSFLFIKFITPSTLLAQVLINEYLPNSDKEWVEFYNTSSSAEYLRNYFIDDDVDFNNDLGSRKKSLIGIDATNSQFPFIEISAFLNNGGDVIVLFDNLGNIVDRHEFTLDPGKNISIGRYPDGSGQFEKLINLSRAGPNSSFLTPVPLSTPFNTQPPATEVSVLTNNTPVATSIKKPVETPTTLKNPIISKTLTSRPEVLSNSDANDNIPSQASEPANFKLETASGNSNKLLALLFIVAGVMLTTTGLISIIKPSFMGKLKNNI